MKGRPQPENTRRRSTTDVFAAALLIVAPLALGAQGARIVRGVVTDPEQRPVSGVTIQLAGARPVTTDDSGRFRLELPHRDRVVFDLRRVGLMPSRFGLNEGGDTSVAIMVLPMAQELATVEVKEKEVDKTMDITGFNQRYEDRKKGTNSGYFFTAADLEQRRPAKISYLFDELPGVKVCRGSGGQICGLFGSQLIREGRGTARPCTITVYVDGQRMNSLGEQVSTRMWEMDIDAMVNPLDIAGLEYYPSGNRIPARFQLLNGSCGAILVWTKRG